MIAQFPAQKITNEIDKLNSTMPAADRDMFEMTISPVVNICTKYRNGVRGEIFFWSMIFFKNLFLFKEC